MASEVDLTTTAVASARQGLSGVTEIASLITAASESIANHVGYPVHRRTDVEETCIGGGQWLMLPKSGAVVTVSEVLVYGSARDADTYVLEDEVKGVIRSNTKPWPFTGRTAGGVSEAQTFREDTGQIVVTHTCGWITPGQVALNGVLTRTLPQVFEEACLLTVMGWARHDPNITSRSLGDASIGYGADSIRGGRVLLPLAARALLARYRKIAR